MVLPNMFNRIETSDQQVALMGLDQDSLGNSINRSAPTERKNTANVHRQNLFEGDSTRKVARDLIFEIQAATVPVRTTSL